MELSHLNPQQKEAVKNCNQPLLVFAGAGSGKTRVIVNKIAYLIQEKKVPPQNILALTFTKKAAEEMKTRVKEIITTSIKGIFVGTFHSWGAYILRRNAENIGYTSSFTIYDSSDKEQSIKLIIKSLNLNDVSVKGVSSLISKLKSSFIMPEDYMKTPKEKKQEEILAYIYNEYEKNKKLSNAVDFDDLLLLPLQLFTDFEDIRNKYSDYYDYILVDEYQDTNRIQYLLLKKITKDKICVVGDDDQSIYSWRGADVTNILQFKKDFPDSEIIKLSVNYRSTQNIIDAAYQVVQNNFVRETKEISSNNGYGDNLTIYEADDDDDESQYCVSKIRQSVEKGYKYSDIAILYRTNAQSRKIEEILVENNIPYTLVGGTRFYERMEIKDLISYITTLLPTKNDIPLLRIVNTPKRGIGNAKIEILNSLAEKYSCSIKEILISYANSKKIKIKYWADEKNIQDINTTDIEKLSFFDPILTILETVTSKNHKTIKELLIEIIKATKFESYLKKSYYDTFEERYDNMQQLLQLTELYTNDIQGITQFNEDITLMTDVDNLNSINDTVSLLTLHASKGLEFPVVHIIGVNEGILPHFRSIDNNNSLEEERRLMYVGMTRAKTELYISYVRYSYNSQKILSPSRFLSEISEDLIQLEYS